MSDDTFYLPIGTLLCNGKYRIVRFIASGGFGCTYEAELTSEPGRRTVAIKEFFVSSICNRSATGEVTIGANTQKPLIAKLEEKFIREARNLMSFSHPNIVAVSEVFQERCTSYYVMEYIAGRSLQDIIDEARRLTEAQAMPIIHQVIDALDYVHSHNMLHLDIKPANIMVEQATGRAVLIDFGVSKQYDEANGHNTSTLLGQTPGYAPLEQLSNNVKQFSPATDIYSLGATLYTALSGLTPPPCTDLLSKVAYLSPLPPGVSNATRRAVHFMMKSGVPERPQSIDEVRALLSGASLANPQPKSDTKPYDNDIKPNPGHGQSDQQGSMETKPYDDDTNRRKKRKSYVLVYFAAAIVVALGVGSYFVLRPSQKPKTSDYLAYYDKEDVGLNNVSPETAIDEPNYEPNYETPAEGEPVSAEYDAEPDYCESEECYMIDYADEATQEHQYVDLGLSVLWADCNVGAYGSSDYGDFFAWGDNYPNGEYTREACDMLELDINHSISGNPNYDPAAYEWGGGWRMPTKEEFDELKRECKWRWTGSGMQVTGPNGNSIFLPAAGNNNEGERHYVGVNGIYWSATPVESNRAWYLDFNANGKNLYHYLRFPGGTIRPVIDRNKVP